MSARWLAAPWVLGLMLVFVSVLSACRGEVVLTYDPPRNEKDASTVTFDARPGPEYVIWSDAAIKDYSLKELAGNEPTRFCYTATVEVLQDDALLTTVQCPAIQTGGVCQRTGSLSAECRTQCRFRVPKAGKTTLRTRLSKAGPCAGKRFGMNDPEHELTRFQFKVEADQ